MADFTMPALGADMETGRVVQWLVQPGQRVRPGDVVAVVETHKGAIDVECFLDGVIDALVPVGSEWPVGARLAQVHAPGDEPAASAGPPPSPPPVPAPDPVIVVAALQQASPGTRRRISPAARRRAAELGLALDTLPASGRDGAVVLADVERAAPAQPARPRGFDPAQMRQAIAAAMSRSKREIPHYYLGTSVDFGAAQAWLAEWNASKAPAERLLPAVLLLKACARALQVHPQFNGFCVDGVFRPAAGIHIGWAIALRGGGLVAPALHDADRKSLPELMAALRDLVQRARSGGLRSSELSDPGITVTSLGERGAESVFGVIYPPQVAILGFGRVLDRPWVQAGQLAVRPLVQLSLAADHRVSDGHAGGQLLAAIDQALQDPATL